MSGRLRPLLPLAAFVIGGPLLIWATVWVPFLGRADLIFVALGALAAAGLALIMGFAGQVSLGHAAFYGIGAYTVAILARDLSLNPVLGILVGLAIAAVVAAALGVAVLRIHGHFLAMATLAFGLIFFFLVRAGGDFTGGNQGIGGIPQLSIGPLDLLTDEVAFLFFWGILGVALLLAQNIVKSRSGRALRALGASEVAAACSGVHVERAKVTVFVVGALYASLAGSLYALYVTFINPDAFGVIVSIEFLVIAAIGGLTSVWGPPLGAVFVLLVEEVTREFVPVFFSGATGSYELVAYGVALVAVLILMREGLAGLFGRLATGPPIGAASSARLIQRLPQRKRGRLRGEAKR